MQLLGSARKRPWWAVGAVFVAMLSPGLLGAIVVSSIAVLGPILSACLLTISVTAQDSMQLPGGLSLTQAAVIASGMSLILALLAQIRRPIPQQRTLFFWTFFLGILLLSAAFSPYSSVEGLKELWRWSAAALTWFILVLFLDRHSQKLLVAISLLIGPVINAVLGLIQFWTGNGPPSFEIAGRFVRAYGTYGQPNSYAGYLNHAWPIALALAIGSSLALLLRKTESSQDLRDSKSTFIARTPRHQAHYDRTSGGLFRPLLSERSQLLFSRWLAFVIVCGLWLITGIILAALLASFSRGAWLGAACGMLAMLMALGGRWRWLGIVAIVLGIAVLVLGGTSLLPVSLTTRLASISGAFRFFDPGSVRVTPQNFAVVERMAQVWAGWKMALAHPLLGVGPGSYSLAYQDVAAAPWFASRGHAHNYYLHISAETGLLGLCSYLALVGSVIVSIVQGLRKPGQSIVQRSILIGSCGMIAAIAGHSLFENLHVLHMPIQMAATWALAQSIADGQTVRRSDNLKV